MDTVFDRDKVLKLFKEVFGSCSQIEGKSLKLMPPDADNVHSKGYQIHIQPNGNESLEACIKKSLKQTT